MNKRHSFWILLHTKELLFITYFSLWESKECTDSGTNYVDLGSSLGLYHCSPSPTSHTFKEAITSGRKSLFVLFFIHHLYSLFRTKNKIEQWFYFSCITLLHVAIFKFNNALYFIATVYILCITYDWTILHLKYCFH